MAATRTGGLRMLVVISLVGILVILGIICAVIWILRSFR